MTLPFALPDWVPWWVQLVLLVFVVLVAGAFLLMPFNVFGVKARLEALDLRLDDLQADLRELSYRLPDPEMRRPAAWRRAEPDEDAFVARSPARREPPHDDVPARPPIPPAPMVPDRERERPTAASTPPVRTSRSEPQLRWPGGRERD